MKIERINDTQIRCVLNHNDLVSRNINLKELSYGSDEARQLFNELINEAGRQLDFEATDAPLMIEAVPMAGDELLLVITRVESPEELDPRFSQFSPRPLSSTSPVFGTPLLLDGADSLMPADGAEEKGKAPAASPLFRSFAFESLDAAADAAASIETPDGIQSRLYKNKSTGILYLVVCAPNENKAEFSRICNNLGDYGRRYSQDASTEAYFAEHCRLLIGHDAIKKLPLINAK